MTVSWSGRDEEPVALGVVGGVDDDGQGVADGGLEALGQLRPADAAGEQRRRSSAPSSGSATSPIRVDRLAVVRRGHADEDRRKPSSRYGAIASAIRLRRAARCGPLPGSRRRSPGTARGPRPRAARTSSRMTIGKLTVSSISDGSRPTRRRSARRGRRGSPGPARTCAARVPGVARSATVRSGLLRARAADEDRQVRLDRPRLARGRRASCRSGRRASNRSPSSSRAHQPDRLVEPVEALAEARPEVDAEGVVLPLEPRAADAEDRPAVADVVHRRRELRGQPGVAERVGADHEARGGSGSSTDAVAVRTTSLRRSAAPTARRSRSRWSHVQTLSQPAASAAWAASGTGARSSSATRAGRRIASSSRERLPELGQPVDRLGVVRPHQVGDDVAEADLDRRPELVGDLARRAEVRMVVRPVACRRCRARASPRTRARLGRVVADDQPVRDASARSRRGSGRPRRSAREDRVLRPAPRARRRCSRRRRSGRSSGASSSARSRR